MTVDLAAGTEGVITFRSGEQFWCPVVEPKRQSYRVRYESGWYVAYHRDGTRADKLSQRDIVAFEPCSYRADLPGEVNP